MVGSLARCLADSLAGPCPVREICPAASLEEDFPVVRARCFGLYRFQASLTRGGHGNDEPSLDHVSGSCLSHVAVAARRASRNQKPSVAGWGWSACYQMRLEHMVPARACQVTPDGESMTQHPQLGGSRIKEDSAKEDFNDSSIYPVETLENERRRMRAEASNLSMVESVLKQNLEVRV